MVTACSSVNELHGESSRNVTNGDKTKMCTESQIQPLESCDHGVARSTEIAFRSMSITPINEQEELHEKQSMRNHDTVSRVFSKPCYFPSHWSMKAVNKELKKGGIFKASFHVNTGNRLEAYCRIDGIQTDVLVRGDVSQNRAVEGDIVAIKVDPLPMWAKIKGFNVISKNSSSTEDSNNGEGLFISASSTELALLSSNITKFPSKRPTGSVVAIIEWSYRRNAIVGFLNVRQWFNHQAGYKKNREKNKSPLVIVDHEQFQLVPNNPKFQKMIVLAKDLPDSIKKMLEVQDATVEMEVVAADIYGWGEGSPFPQARNLRIFGRADKMEPQINAILCENVICVSDFSPESLSCIPPVPWEVSSEEIRNRKDLRSLCIFTIDPSTATDLDDALSVEKLSDGIFRVGVHIADVSYFVLPGTALDTEAQMRSTSVYMSRSKLPMLPPLLSENIASLTPGIDKLAFSIFWDLNNAGDIINHWIGRSVIQSCCKLSYDCAQEIINAEIDVSDFPPLHGNFKRHDVIKSVKGLYEISKVLKEKRFNGGALRLGGLKVDFMFDEHGIPYDSTFIESKDSNFLVEEFMLLANKTVAEVISKSFPDNALLRRHPEPNMRKLEEFKAFCSKHGFDLDISSSGQLHSSLESIRTKLKDDPVLFDVLISYATKPMQLASYFCSGELKENAIDSAHYAMGIPFYTHFTSPLRRYPDIVVHRTLMATLEAEKIYLKCMEIIAESQACFSGIYFDKNAAESPDGREALVAASLKHRVPDTESLAKIATFCNERRIAARHVKDSCNKLYMWFMLKNKHILFSEARVLNLGPRFMTIYIQKLAIERRIHYDEVKGLMVKWQGRTSTLGLNLRLSKHANYENYKPLEEFAYVVHPCYANNSATRQPTADLNALAKCVIRPEIFPLTVGPLSTIPVALHAAGGDGGPLEIGVRLYMSSYLSNSYLG